MVFIQSLLIFSVSTLALGHLLKCYRRGLQLPPGPKGLPILGNILEVQAKHKEPLYITYSNWSKIYGDVFTFNVFGTRTVVLNSYKAITELLDHRSHNYSDRPHLVMACDLARWDFSFGFMGYSNMWRLHRRTFHQFFQPRTIPDYYNIQRERTASLVQKLATSPKNLFHHVRVHSGGIILEIVYGYRIKDNDDPYVNLVDNALVGLREAGAHGSFLVDYIPILKYLPTWFPGAGFKAKAEVWARDVERLIDIPWTQLKRLMGEGTAVPCFSTRNLEKFEGNNLVMEEVIKSCAAVTFVAGADTTVSAILSFILAMVLNPQIQARAQKEIDDVLGSSRLPDFADRGCLPYINAILSETLRWKPVTPYSSPHRNVEDDMYEGYLIPAGSTIVPNVWGVFHDESLYGPETMSFNPERFMKKDDEKGLPPNPELIAFGFGRRICPGRHLAMNSIWLTMTYLLASFTMAKDLDDEGKEIDPVVEYSDGFISHA
ncbi:hypothetical protein E1B28_013406 [Marasmius oreades]|uniref:Cytochrome P450 n=1 Tax=Marasmius oreades TaxID=181124 RepID=A0A9P7UMZ3_9AGAR|nr:uncharacterized protein E1B28_013406 [Marasmius oreades]KAG7087440.1 hypothetical protein E1B28_013406 [Marasmius oreades]